MSPWPGKCFLGRDRAVLLKPAHECRAEPGHRGGILPEGAGGDDRVLRVVVDVQNGREGEVDPHGARLGGGDAAHFVGVAAFAGRAHCHQRRKQGGAAQLDVVGQVDRPAHAVASPALQVGGDQQRVPGQRLQVVDLGGHLGRRTHRDDHAAHAVLSNRLRDALEVLGALGREVAQHPRHQQLAGFLLEGHRLQNRGGPGAGCFGRGRGTGDARLAGPGRSRARSSRPGSRSGGRRSRGCRRWSRSSGCFRRRLGSRSRRRRSGGSRPGGRGRRILAGRFGGAGAGRFGGGLTRRKHGTGGSQHRTKRQD